METVLKFLSKFLGIVEKVLKVIVAVFMFAMVGVIFYQVILRYVFNSANIWSEELARYLMCYVVLFGAFIAMRRDSHLKVEFLINMLKPRARCIAVALCSLVGAIFLGYYFIYAVDLCQNTVNSISSGTGIPMSYAYACLPVGAGLMILACIELILKEILKFNELGKQGGDPK